MLGRCSHARKVLSAGSWRVLSQYGSERSAFCTGLDGGAESLACVQGAWAWRLAGGLNRVGFTGETQLPRAEGEDNHEHRCDAGAATRWRLQPRQPAGLESSNAR